jgi:hypothetical protein
MGRSTLQKMKRSLRKNLEAYYAFDDGNGANAPNDSTSNNRDLASTTLSTSDGILGAGCMVGAGSDASVGSLSIAVTNFSVSLWFKFLSTASASTATHIISKSGGDVLTIDIQRNSADVVITPLDQDAITTDAVAADTWHHLAVVVQGSVTTVFLNRAQIGTTTAPASSTLTGWTIRETAKVATDELAIYSKALSPAEVAYLYQAGRGFNPYSVSA